MIYTLLVLLLFPVEKLAASNEIVNGRNFRVLATQEINFVPLRKIDSNFFNDPSLPRHIDLRPIQSKVKSQGMRGACTYFVITGLVESLIKKEYKREVDLSEEYLAWATKQKKKIRALEEDSSVAANAAAIQDHGFMFEVDLPYQQSWFDKGHPCEGRKGKSLVDPICYSHRGPEEKNRSKIVAASGLEFRDIGSSSVEVIRELSKWQTPVTVSILGHSKMWKETRNTGDIYLDASTKKECQTNRKACSGHAALIVGYNLDKKVFIFKNSWGEQWGQNGYGTIPFEYIDQMSDRRFLIGKINKPILVPD